LVLILFKLNTRKFSIANEIGVVNHIFTNLQTPNTFAIKYKNSAIKYEISVSY